MGVEMSGDAVRPSDARNFVDKLRHFGTFFSAELPFSNNLSSDRTHNI